MLKKQVYVTYWKFMLNWDVSPDLNEPPVVPDFILYMFKMYVSQMDPHKHIPDSLDCWSLFFHSSAVFYVQF